MRGCKAGPASDLRSHEKAIHGRFADRIIRKEERAARFAADERALVAYRSLTKRRIRPICRPKVYKMVYTAAVYKMAKKEALRNSLSRKAL